MSKFKTVAFLVPGHALFAIFPDGEVPVQSFVPQLDHPDSEPYFLLDGSLLDDEHLKRLGKHILIHQSDFFSDSKEAELFALLGWPIFCCEFEGGRTYDLNVMLTALDEVLKESEDYGDLDADGGLDL